MTPREAAEFERGREHGKEAARWRTMQPSALSNHLRRYFLAWVVEEGDDGPRPCDLPEGFRGAWEAYQAGFMEGHTE